MSWKLFVGSTAETVLSAALSKSFFPLIREFPRGWNWVYDACRFAGTRYFTVIFDIGANEGQTALQLATFFPKASILAFEPVQANFAKLRTATSDRGNISIFNKALGNKVEQRAIHLYNHSALHSFVSGKTIAPASSQTEKVEVDTLENVCATLRIDAIDILKMDVQGWELQVLEGAQKMLQSTKFIFTEVGFERDVDDMTAFGALHQTITDHGFRLCGFYDFNRWGDRKEWLSFANALYINLREPIGCRP